MRWAKRTPAALDGLLRVVLSETLRFGYFPLRVADLCRAYGMPPHTDVLTTPPELLTVLRRRKAARGTRVVCPDPPLGTDELSLVSEFAPALGKITPTALIASR